MIYNVKHIYITITNGEEKHRFYIKLKSFLNSLQNTWVIFHDIFRKKKVQKNPTGYLNSQKVEKKERRRKH